MRRLNFIALVIFLGGLVWVFTWKTQTAMEIKGRVMSVFSPFVRTGAAVREKVTEVAAPARSPAELAQENARLHQELAELRIYGEEYQRLKQENDDLRRMLDFARTHPLKLTPARILTRNSATWWNSATIDRGFHDGLAPELPVRTGEGLVGKVIHVWPRESEVLFITDETCKVAVRIEGTPDQGILSGIRGVSGRTPDLRIGFLPAQASVTVGARVFTSGKGGIFPAGILVGEVTRFNHLDNGAEAWVRPAVDFDQLKQVFVIQPDAEEVSAPPVEARLAQ